MANPNPRIDHLEATRFTSGNVAANAGRKGGFAKAKAERERRTQQEIATEILNLAIDAGAIDEVEFIKDAKGKNLSAGYAALLMQMQKAIKGDGRAYALVRDTAGEQPVQKVEVNSDVAAAEKRLGEMIAKMDEADAQ